MKEKTWLVIMFEPAVKGETLTLSEQVNEVFGPFNSDGEAERWVKEMQEYYHSSRQWLICPLSNPNVINLLNPLTN